MDTRKYTIDRITIKNLLSDISQGKISMPEIQRPFVWDRTKVRDLIDSINRGFPIGYIITSTDPEMKQKDGSRASGRTSIIDGQQRITALRAAILGEPVVDKNFKKYTIQIAYNPLADPMKNENKFETLTPAIEKTPHWIPDISKIVDRDYFEIAAYVQDYQDRNPEIPRTTIENAIKELQNLKDQEIGLIKLRSEALDINEIADIFERINSKGVALNQADFTMSKLAADPNCGSSVRKLIDYFTHLIKEPHFYDDIRENDPEFYATGLLSSISWARNYSSSIYLPDYSDVIRTAFSYGFKRGKLADLVALLAGRNFETRKYEQDIADSTIQTLKESILSYVNKNNFTDFIQIIDSTGFIDASMIGSKNALNYAYAIFLLLKKNNYNPSDIKKYVSRWFVMSILTSRYSSSPESAIDRDIKEISRVGIKEFLVKQEPTTEFWTKTLLNDFDKASMQHPYLNTFFAAQVCFGETGFLSDVSLRSIREIKGDIHHTFPYEYLKTNGKKERFEYNQIANFVYMEKSTNIQIGKMEPRQYMAIVLNQAKTGKLDPEHPIGKILDQAHLMKNLEDNCIPTNFCEMTIDDYDSYLLERRKKMVQKIKKYYEAL